MAILLFGNAAKRRTTQERKYDGDSIDEFDVWIDGSRNLCYNTQWRKYI